MWISFFLIWWWKSGSAAPALPPQLHLVLVPDSCGTNTFHLDSRSEHDTSNWLQGEQARNGSVWDLNQRIQLIQAAANKIGSDLVNGGKMIQHTWQPTRRHREKRDLLVSTRAPGAEPTNDPTEPNFPFLDFVSFPFRFCFRRQGAQLIINAR